MYYYKTATIDQYLRRLSGQDKEPQNLDHNYVKNWSAHPDSQRTKPARMLFMNTFQRHRRIVDDEEIDVLTPEKKVSYGPSPFDSPKSKSLANELERSLKCNPQLFHADREESEDILKSCSYQQRRIYQHVTQVLNDAILAKTVYSSQPHESIKRKIATEKCARRLRLVFANNFYDFDLINWIHKTILEKSGFETVVSYLYLLQALRAKIPTLVDKILRSYSGCFEFLTQILKKQFDPVAPLLNQIKPRKLTSNPFLLMSCAGFDLQKADQSSRFRFWVSHLNALCKTIYVPIVSDDGIRPSTLKDMVDVAVSSMKQKINELRNHFPHRPIILAGWTIGALIACHVALEMPVDSVLCFGFPLTGVNGSRGDLDDPLLISNKPTLFIVGQNANMCSTDDMEDFRSRMSGETGLVVIGGADDLLRISPKKMMEECITQTMVDRCILDEISDFLQAALMKLPSTSAVVSANSLKSCPTILEESPDISDQEDERKRKRRKPKEYSPELQPSRKRPRHSVSKEIPCAPLKSRLSPSSSETSSSGSFKFEKPNMMKSVKKGPEKRRVGRPPSGASRKKPTSKPVKPTIKHFIKPIIKPLIKPIVKPLATGKVESPIKITLKHDSLIPIPISPPKQPSVIEVKPAIPFALNILPKRNDPVDVEMAFGKDSIFLPRPLTPPELLASEALGKVSTVPKIPVPKPGPSTIQNASPTNPQPQNISTSEKSIISLIEQPPVTAAVSKVPCGSIIKPIINTPDSKKGIAVSVASPSFKVFQQGKVVNSNPVAQLKNVSRVKLIGSPLNQASTINTSKTLITVPTNSTILVSGSTLKTHSGKVLKLLSKGPIALKKKDLVTTSSTSTGTAEPAEQQVCNLSLLSDVAGMTEPLKDTRKAEPCSSSATLVKLAVPDKPQHLKHFQVLKSFQSRPATTRIDTPEEMVEKQLAIQALNKSIGVDSFSQPAKESDYSICFTKPDGSILSRAVPRTGHTTYIRQSLLPQQSGRGRQRPVLPSKTYQFYHK